MSDVERITHSREAAGILREHLRARGLRQMDLAASSGLSQPQVSVRLSGAGAAIPVRQFEAMCAALGLDPTVVLEQAEQRVTRREERSTELRRRSAAELLTSVEAREQIQALGRQIAIAIWNGCDNRDYVGLIVNEMLTQREDRQFWTSERLARAAMWALVDLGTGIGGRLEQAVRDPFILKERMDALDIVP